MSTLCQRQRTTTSSTRSTAEDGAPMDLVTMDIRSFLPTADDGSKYLLVVVDVFTKCVEAYPLPDQEAATCITAVYNGMFSRFGLPRQLHSDQGRNFESQLVTELCNITGVYKARTTAFHPRSHGLTERANRTTLAMLRAATYRLKEVVVEASVSVSRLPHDSPLNHRCNAKPSHARKRSVASCITHRGAS